MRSKGLLLPVKAVTDRQREEMFALMDRHYENVTWPAFNADLEGKQWVILLLDPQTEAVSGFSTQVLLRATVADRPVHALFSGDTVVGRDHRGDSVLAHVWGRLALSLSDELGGAELYWFLISKGYKTYRFLPLFFHEFYPRQDVATPVRVREVIDALAQERFGADYDASGGVVRGGPLKDRLRPGVADLTAERLRDLHVAFFAQANPKHAAGDELCCLAPISRANFTAAAYRVIGPESVVCEVSA
jgi:hypothetical protein